MAPCIEIFSYVEEKGMEMEIKILSTDNQAAFMLSALRDLRQDTKAKKSKKKETEGEDKGVVLGPLMGPAIKSDKGPAPELPPDFDVPEHLEFINLEISLPVGFKRLRWAMLSPMSTFTKDALLGEAKCENVIIKEWSHHNDVIGSAVLPEGVNEKDIIGAERESEYLMPKSTFVRANTVYDTSQIIAYNDYCLCIKKRTLSPDVPYGTTFLTWTQILITNTGNDTCHLTTSVEAEFPNGPPIISRQIVSGMRSGTAESFILMSEIIIKYADEFP
jgi:VAD1 Analog of StAR-related lipid transfer domain